MATGSGFPDEYVPILRAQNPGSSKNENSLELANLRITLALP